MGRLHSRHHSDLWLTNVQGNIGARQSSTPRHSVIDRLRRSWSPQGPAPRGPRTRSSFSAFGCSARTDFHIVKVHFLAAVVTTAPGSPRTVRSLWYLGKSSRSCPLRAALARSHRGIHILKVHLLAAAFRNGVVVPSVTISRPQFSAATIAEHFSKAQVARLFDNSLQLGPCRDGACKSY